MILNLEEMKNNQTYEVIGFLRVVTSSLEKNFRSRSRKSQIKKWSI